jgi:ethanolamine ammonia-lyase large subunit
VNPASDDVGAVRALLELIDQLRLRLEIPTQSCVLSHVTTTLELIQAGASVDLVFQSMGVLDQAGRLVPAPAPLLLERAGLAG